MDLTSQTVHIWQASLLQNQESLARLEQTLSSDEQARTQRFHFDRDRRRYIAGRGVLRDLLGRYLNQEARQIEITYTKQGKPHLLEYSQPRGLCFNLAHSHELAIYAFAIQQDLGVDLEYISPIPDMEQVASEFFAAGEFQTWKALPQEQKSLGFFNAWTRKEAYLKARGDGLSKPLDQFEVSLTPNEPARLLHIDGDEQEIYRWSLFDLPLDTTNYVAALALRKPGFPIEAIKIFSWPEDRYA